MVYELQINKLMRLGSTQTEIVRHLVVERRVTAAWDSPVGGFLIRFVLQMQTEN